MVLLKTEHLAVGIGSRCLIASLDLEVRAGELWAILGPNGCGKSTLLNMLAGLKAPLAGTIALSGEPLARLSPRAAARMRALLPQRQYDAFGSPVSECVLAGRHPYIGRFGFSSDIDREIAVAAMRDMDVEHLAGRDVLTLSGGERQRVAIATLLAQATPLMLLDEPTAHLDLSHQARLFDVLTRRTQQGGAVIVATHEMNLALRFATHALLINPAGQTSTGRVDEVLTAQTISALLAFPVAEIARDGRRVFAPQW
jgi:iron complex transport system ATP-binding protein